MYGLNCSPCASFLLSLAFKNKKKKQHKYWLLDCRLPPVLSTYINKYYFISSSELNPNIPLQLWSMKKASES